jgi:hypothetical protein
MFFCFPQLGLFAGREVEVRFHQKMSRGRRESATTLVTFPFVILLFLSVCFLRTVCFVFAIGSDLISFRLIIFSWYFRIYSNSNYCDSLHILTKRELLLNSWNENVDRNEILNMTHDY